MTEDGIDEYELHFKTLYGKTSINELLSAISELVQCFNSITKPNFQNRTAPLLTPATVWHRQKTSREQYIVSSIHSFQCLSKAEIILDELFQEILFRECWFE